MRCPRNRILSMCLSLWLGGCAWIGAETPPEWLVSPQNAYPAKQFLTGMGEASKREQAERRAYAAVARIFSANIQAQALDQESYATQITGDIRRTQQTLQLNQRTKVTTNKVLENVKILEVWYQSSTRQFFALAGLDRKQAEQVILDRLRDWDLTIENTVAQGRSDTHKIQRIRGYKKALRLLVERERLNADLRVIRNSGESQSPPYRVPDIQQEFQDFVGQEVAIVVSIDGENQKEIERAILESLEQEGLFGKTASTFHKEITGGEDILIVGQGKLWAVDLPDPLFKYVRWCGDIDIYEQPSQQLIGVISETGREGHITEQEARVRANGSMQEVLGQEVSRLLTQSLFSENQHESNKIRKPQACPQ